MARKYYSHFKGQYMQSELRSIVWANRSKIYGLFSGVAFHMMS
jgi:hypothetical protein